MATVTVHALNGGTLILPERFFINPADPEAEQRVPSLCFLVQHQNDTKTTRIVFDLGLRRDISLYPEALQKHCRTRGPMTVLPDVTASLADGGLTVNDIDYVFLSHVHYDHIGLPSDFSNPKTQFIIGPGAMDVLDGRIKLHGNHSVFEKDIFPLERLIELPSTKTSHSSADHVSPSTTLNQTWTPLPPFPDAIDLFSDSTVYLISAPGHLPGHFNLLCQLTPDKYILLAGDACHDMRLFTGERDIATWQDDEGNTCCIHYDIPAAKETIARLAKVEKEGIEIRGRKVEVEIVFAHNHAWEVDAKKRGRFWPGKC